MERRFAVLLAAGLRFSADDVTADGAVALDGAHTPNGRQSGIGSMFRMLHRRGLIEQTGEIVRSRAPHRKGGMIQVWMPTGAGQQWARSRLT